MLDRAHWSLEPETVRCRHRGEQQSSESLTIASRLCMCLVVALVVVVFFFFFVVFVVVLFLLRGHGPLRSRALRVCVAAGASRSRSPRSSSRCLALVADALRTASVNGVAFLLLLVSRRRQLLARAKRPQRRLLAPRWPFQASSPHPTSPHPTSHHFTSPHFTWAAMRRCLASPTFSRARTLLRRASPLAIAGATLGIGVPQQCNTPRTKM